MSVGVARAPGSCATALAESPSLTRRYCPVEALDIDYRAQLVIRCAFLPVAMSDSISAGSRQSFLEQRRVVAVFIVLQQAVLHAATFCMQQRFPADIVFRCVSAES